MRVMTVMMMTGNGIAIVAVNDVICRVVADNGWIGAILEKKLKVI